MLGAGAIAASGAQAADYPVTNTNGLGPGSLRDAITTSNIALGADTISFTADATGRIELASALPAITGPLAINGPGADKLTVDANGNGSAFSITVTPNAGIPVSISGLKIVGGDSSNAGGGIANYGSDLTVADAVISGNDAGEYGGGIYGDGGTLEIRNSTLTNNYAGDGSGNDYGGGVMVLGTPGAEPVEVLITGSVFKGNSAFGDGGAGYFEDVDNDVVVRNTTVTGNISREDGGGFVFSAGDGSSNAVLIDSSTFDGNVAEDGGGGIWFLDASESQTVVNSTFTGNFADDGGGFYDDSSDDIPTVVRNSTIVGNEAKDVGGGIYNENTGPAESFIISSSIVSGNFAGTGPDLGDDGDGTFTDRQQPDRHARRPDGPVQRRPRPARTRSASTRSSVR